MWAKDHTQAIRLGSRHLYSLSQLADPLTDLLNTFTDDKGSVGAQRDGSVPKSTFIPLPEDPNSTRSTYITWPITSATEDTTLFWPSWALTCTLIYPQVDTHT